MKDGSTHINKTPQRKTIKRMLSKYLSDMPLNAWHLETRMLTPSPPTSNILVIPPYSNHRKKRVKKREGKSLRDLKFCFLAVSIWTMTVVGLTEFVSNYWRMYEEEAASPDSSRRVSSLLTAFREYELAHRHPLRRRNQLQQDSVPIIPQEQETPMDNPKESSDESYLASSNENSNKRTHKTNSTTPILVDISYVNVTDGYRHHPHMGAKDEAGHWGYIHDATALRQNPPPPLAGYSFGKDGATLREACAIHDANYKMIHEKVHVLQESEPLLQQSTTASNHAKLFCIVYTTEHSHAHKIPPIRETWGPKCEGFMVASTKTNTSLNTVEIPHAGDEAYENIWQKIRSVWSYVYDHYYEEYDWFHIGGEDMMVIPENLRAYLESDEIQMAAVGGQDIHSTSTRDGNNSHSNATMQVPLYLGGRLAFEGDKNTIFNQGGGGYTLNKAALKMLVLEGIPNHFTDAQTFTEDVMISKVFAKLGVHPYDTRDEFGGERYNPYSPGYHYDFRKPQDKYHQKKWYAAYLLEEEGHEFIEGVHHCAAHSVSFHYIKVDLMYRLFALLYNLCPEESSESNMDKNSMVETQFSREAAKAII